MPDGPSQRWERVAVAHDWVTAPGGSEKVVAALLELFPEAELFTAIFNPAVAPPVLRERRVHVSYLDRIPGAHRRYQSLLPLVSAAFESFDLSDFGLVLSSSHACAKNVITRPGTLHVCYCHTPMRYAWDPRFLAGEDVGRVRRAALSLLLPRLRREDVVGASRPDHFVANSTWVAARIEKYYRRTARVIHPPVEVARLLDTPRSEGDYYLALGRVIPYKRADVAVAACARLARPLKVVGTGRSLEEVRALAQDAPRIEFLGAVPDAELPGILAGARALLFPGEEDFGMVPVEAHAAGVPVIAYGVGGVRDTVVDGETGILYDEPTVEGLCRAIERFEATSFEEAVIRDRARIFAPERFREAFTALLDELAPAPG